MSRLGFETIRIKKGTRVASIDSASPQTKRTIVQSIVAKTISAKGWLLKSPSNKKRWVVLRNGTLTLRESVHDIVAQRTIPLSGISALTQIEKIPPGLKSDAADTSFSFEFAGKVMAFVAATRMDRNNWVDRLRAAARAEADTAASGGASEGADESDADGGYSSSGDGELTKDDLAEVLELRQPLVAEARGWVAEPLDPHVLQGRATLNVTVEDPDVIADWYRHFFVPSAHEVYVGSVDSAGPLAVALLCKDDETAREVRTIVWTKNGTHRLRRLSVKGRSSRAELRQALEAAGPEFAGAAKRLTLSDDPVLRDELLAMEHAQLPKRYKFGVVYVRQGQTSEREFLPNDADPAADARFCAFLDLLGTRIPLKGWNGYRAGLDVEAGGTGVESVFTEHCGYDIMFHVAPFLPHDREASGQEVQRKRQIGNDITAIIFVDGTTPYDPTAIVCQFMHQVVVVQPGPEQGTYLAQWARQTSVQAFGPPVPSYEWEAGNDFRDFLLTKLINGERSALRSADSFATNAKRTQENMLDGLLKRVAAGSASAKPMPAAVIPRLALPGKDDAGTPRAAIRGRPSRNRLVDVCVLREFGGEIQCLDVWGTAMLLANGEGLFVAAGDQPNRAPTPLTDARVIALAVVESRGGIVFQAKGGALFTIFLSAIGPCPPEEIRGTRGTGPFAVGHLPNDQLFLCSATGKDLTLHAWEGVTFHRAGRIPLPAVASVIRWCRRGFVVGHSKGFWFVAPRSAEVTKLVKFSDGEGTGDSAPVDALYISSTELLLVSGTRGRFASFAGKRSRLFDIQFSVLPTAVVLTRPFVLAVSPLQIELRSLRNGALVQVISLPPPARLLSSKFDVLVGSGAVPGKTILYTLAQLSDSFSLRTGELGLPTAAAAPHTRRLSDAGMPPALPAVPPSPSIAAAAHVARSVSGDLEGSQSDLSPAPAVGSLQLSDLVPTQRSAADASAASAAATASAPATPVRKSSPPVVPQSRVLSAAAPKQKVSMAWRKRTEGGGALRRGLHLLQTEASPDLDADTIRGAFVIPTTPLARDPAEQSATTVPSMKTSRRGSKSKGATAQAAGAGAEAGAAGAAAKAGGSSSSSGSSSSTGSSSSSSSSVSASDECQSMSLTMVRPTADELAISSSDSDGGSPSS